MDLDYSSEQQMLREGAQRFLADHYDIAGRASAAANVDGFRRDVWRQFAELGWLGLAMPEKEDSLSVQGVDVAILMTELGRVAALEPYMSTAILGGGLLARMADSRHRALLPQVISGEVLLAFAHGEGTHADDSTNLKSTARRQGGAWRLDAHKLTVPDAAAADYLLISARIAPDSTGLFCLPAATPGVQIEPFTMIDDKRAANLRLDSVSVADDMRVGDAEDASAHIVAAIERGIAALCAEMVGGLEVLLEATLTHCSTRVQFSQPLVEFQVVRHRLAEMSIALEEARAAALFAALHTDSNPGLRMRATSAAKAKVGRAARFISQQCVQLHGGMGVTEELPIGIFFKRALAFDLTWGNSEHHSRRIGRALRDHRIAAGEAMICSRFS